jgi:hypothetical protein
MKRGVAGSQAARQSAALAPAGGANVQPRIYRPHRHRCSRPPGGQAVLRRAHADPGASGLVRDDGSRRVQLRARWRSRLAGLLLPALEPAPYSRHGTGLQHLSFAVSSRAQVREAHDWAVAHNAEVVHERREFPSTASTTPRTSLIPTASCSRSSATAPARRDSRRTGSRRCDGIPALEPAGRPLRRGSSAGRQAAGQAGRWPSVTAIPAGRNASQTLPNVPAEVLPSTVLMLGSSGGEAWFRSATRSCPDARGIASRQSASTGEVSWLPP